MAKLRKWVAYRRLERPNTRFSKVRNKAYVKARPGKKVVKYYMGDLRADPNNFPVKLKLIAKEDGQIRANAIEAGRVTALKGLEKEMGKTGFYYRVKAIPHHVIRENPLAAGAGADRLSTGMKHSFGKTIGTAAQVPKGKDLFELWLPEGKEDFGRSMLKKTSKKLPLKTSIVLEE